MMSRTSPHNIKTSNKQNTAPQSSPSGRRSLFSFFHVCVCVWGTKVSDLTLVCVLELLSGRGLRSSVLFVACLDIVGGLALMMAGHHGKEMEEAVLANDVAHLATHLSRNWKAMLLLYTLSPPDTFLPTSAHPVEGAGGWQAVGGSLGGGGGGVGGEGRRAGEGGEEIRCDLQGKIADDSLEQANKAAQALIIREYQSCLLSLTYVCIVE